MPAVQTSWLVGSLVLPPVTLVGFDSQTITVPGGTYYLRHPTAGLSLLDVVNTAIDASASAITCTSLVVLESRLVQINLSAPANLNFATGDTNGDVLAAALGFSGADLTGAASYTATRPSPLLFSAAYPATPKTIAGVTGYTKLKQAVMKAADGSRMRRVGFGNEIWQELSWPHIVPSRLQVTGTEHAQSGTFHQFFEQSLSRGYKLLHYEQMTEDAASSTPATWSTPLGPYELRDGFDGDWYTRNVSNAEISSPLKLPLLAVSEYP